MGEEVEVVRKRICDGVCANGKRCDKPARYEIVTDGQELCGLHGRAIWKKDKRAVRLIAPSPDQTASRTKIYTKEDVRKYMHRHFVDLEDAVKHFVQMGYEYAGATPAKKGS